jgi:hypothetical protein
MGVLALRDRYGILQEFRGSYAGSQASVNIASVGDSQARIVVAKLVLSQNASGFFTLQSGTTNIGPGFFGGANAGMALDEPDIVASAGAALNFTSQIPGSHVLFVKFYTQGYSG